MWVRLKRDDRCILKVFGVGFGRGRSNIGISIGLGLGQIAKITFVCIVNPNISLNRETSSVGRLTLIGLSTK